MKDLDISYKEIVLMRELLIEELRSQMPTIGIEAMKLVEMRLQTLFMAGVTKDKIEVERKNFK